MTEEDKAKLLDPKNEGLLYDLLYRYLKEYYKKLLNIRWYDTTSRLFVYEISRNLDHKQTKIISNFPIK